MLSTQTTQATPTLSSEVRSLKTKACTFAMTTPVMARHNEWHYMCEVRSPCTILSSQNMSCHRFYVFLKNSDINRLIWHLQNNIPRKRVAKSGDFFPRRLTTVHTLPCEIHNLISAVCNSTTMSEILIEWTRLVQSWNTRLAMSKKLFGVVCSSTNTRIESLSPLVTASSTTPCWKPAYVLVKLYRHLCDTIYCHFARILPALLPKRSSQSH